MKEQPLTFEYQIRTKKVRFGKWIYVIELSQEISKASRKFATQEAALRDAQELLFYMR